MSVTEARSVLKDRIGHIRCEELRGILESLGFVVRNGNRGGHKVFAHPGLKEFLGASYNCGHGKNPEIKRPYISDVIKLLSRFEAELTDWQQRENP